MQDGNRTQIFHQGPFTSLPDHGPGPVRVSWGGGGFCTGRCSMFSTHTHTPFGRDGCRENVFLFSSSRSLLLHSLNKPVLPSHNQEGRRPETRTRLTVFLRRSDCRRFLAHTPPPSGIQLTTLWFCRPLPSYECNFVVASRRSSYVVKI